MKELSVIICTRNRVNILAKNLEELSKQLSDKDELIVVDNGSTDSTAGLVREYCNKFSFVSSLFVPFPGKSTARNKGIEQASGKYLALLDDDVITFRDWREKASIAFTVLPSTCGAVTGQIIPKIDGEIPWWMSDTDFRSLSSRVLLGDKSKQYPKENPVLVTANVLCKKEVIDQVGGFNPIFDICGYGEDIELAIRISKAGYDIYYFPELKVNHVLASSRFSFESLMRRRYNGAIGEFLISCISSESNLGKASLIGKQLVIRPFSLIAATTLLLIAKINGNERKAIFSRTRIARSLGYLKAVGFVLKRAAYRFSRSLPCLWI